MQRFAIEILTTYGIYLLATFLLIGRHGKRDRLPSVVVAWAMPVLVVVGVVWTTANILLRRPPRIGPCPDGLEAAERAIAKRRQELFGGPLMRPHVAARWAKQYSLTLELEAERLQRLARKLWNSGAAQRPA